MCIHRQCCLMRRSPLLQLRGGDGEVSCRHLVDRDTQDGHLQVKGNKHSAATTYVQPPAADPLLHFGYSALGPRGPACARTTQPPQHSTALPAAGDLTFCSDSRTFFIVAFCTSSRIGRSLACPHTNAHKQQQQQPNMRTNGSDTARCESAQLIQAAPGWTELPAPRCHVQTSCCHAHHSRRAFRHTA